MERPLQPSQLRAPTVFRNLLINGDFQIDQRNAGAAKSIASTGNTYCMDRWFGFGQNTEGVFSVQQVTTSVPVSGAKYACKITTTTADASIGSAQIYGIAQSVEGNNISNLMFGTAGAKTITLSFWVRSSLTGLFTGSLYNGSNNRSCPFTFTIFAADTWQKIIVVVPGDVTGTWASDNSKGITLLISAGLGSSYKGTPGAWAAGAYYGSTGAVDLISTLNATLYLADVQLEAGSGASDFERLPVDAVLRRCQRYFTILTTSIQGYLQAGTFSMSNSVILPVLMRADPGLSPTRTYRGSTLVNLYDTGSPGMSSLSNNQAVELWQQAAAAGNTQARGTIWWLDVEL
jgi:hypothetical protein